MQKAQCPGDSTVLVVNPAVQMSVVGIHDQPSRTREIRIGPTADLHLIGKSPAARKARRKFRDRWLIQALLHEEAREDIEAITLKDLTMNAVRMQQQL